MNRKKFDIWQKWRGQQHSIDVEALRDDHARRGIAVSGIRNQAEDHLNQKYRSEVEMEKAAMEAEEAETQGREEQRRNQIKTNWIVATGSLIAAIGSLGSFVLAFPQFSKIQVRIDSLQASIEHLYQLYVQDTFSFDQVKNLFQKSQAGTDLTLKLTHTPIAQSVNVWWWSMHLSPTDFDVKNNSVTIHFSQSIDVMRAAQEPGDNQNEFVITYTQSQ